MKYITSFTLIVFFTFANVANAITPLHKADSAYKTKNYTEAIALYNQSLNNIEKQAIDNSLKSTVFYNIGNCYYRLKDYAHAILYYQRSLRLDPANKDAAFNLELTQTKITDRFNAPTEMFFISWIKTFIQSQSSNTWGQWAIIMLFLTFITFAIYYFIHCIWLRKLSLTFTTLFALMFITCQLFAFSQYKRFTGMQQGVVMQQTDTFDSPTSSAKKICTLHEGTIITLTDSYKGGWIEIQLPDERNVWIKGENNIEKVM